MERSTLPSDATYKGLEPFTVQEGVFSGEVVRYLREKWYAASTGKSYLAPLPPGSKDHCGPRVKALALLLYHASGVSEPKILELLSSVGLRVSAGTLSAWLVGDLAALHADAAAVYQAGLAGSSWQQVDDTATRVNGVNYHCQVVCTPLYTSYHTRPSKDRLSIVDLLRPGQEGTYLLNALALDWLERVGVSAGVRAQVAAHLPRDTLLDHATLLRLLDARLGHLGSGQRARILDATAIAAYQMQTTLPVVEVLVCDDAGQCIGVTLGLVLCWVHDARHYTKLFPLAPENQARPRAFMAEYWAFYADLLTYRAQPTAAAAERLRARFDVLFTTQTGYLALDERIAKTHAHRTALLLVLDHPELPLHNNRSELGARRRVPSVMSASARAPWPAPTPGTPCRPWPPPPSNMVSTSSTISATAFPAPTRSPASPTSSLAPPGSLLLLPRLSEKILAHHQPAPSTEPAPAPPQQPDALEETPGGTLPY